MEWLDEVQWLWWVAGALVLGLLEITTLDLTFSMLAVAAVAAAGASALGAGVVVQVGVFVATALILLGLLRPYALRKLRPLGAAHKTNAEAGIGQQAEVLREVTGRGGLVKLRGEEWSARADSASATYPPGQNVTVLRIDGATVVVSAPAPDEPEGEPDHA